jgi:protein-tyrosine phosphatase
MQRSAAVVAMALIAITGQPSEKVIAYIRSQRPVAFFPEANFKDSIIGFEKHFQESVNRQRRN